MDAPAPDPDAPTVTRSVELDADVADVVAALDDPELLSAWLGTWVDGPDGPVVVTDDGIARRVTDRRGTDPGHEGDGASRSWTWRPIDEPGAVSTVTFVVRRSGDATVLTVEERRDPTVRASAAATAPSVPWLRQLLALGAVLALGAPARV